MTQLGEAFVPIRATLDKLDGDLAAAKNKIGGALESIGESGGKLLSAGLVAAAAAATAAFAALGAGIAFSIGQALEAEKSQSQLALSVGLANDAIRQQADEYAAASGQVVSSTRLSADSLNELQDKLTHATARLHDMEAAYAENKSPTESQTLALQDQRNAVAELTAEIAAGSEVITSSLVDALGLVPPSAEFTIESLNALAQEFMDLAGGSDDAITAIETIALRAGTVSSDEMPAFIQTVLDLGTVMGDTTTAATLLARAQEDPIAAMGRLQRTGLIFSESLKTQIEQMVKQGDTAGATALLLDRVAEATGGAAAANAATLSGQWEIMKGHMSEAAETIGNAFLPALSALFDNVLKPAIPVVESIAESIASFIATFTSGDFEDPLGNLANLVYEVANALGLDGEGLFFAITNLREPLEGMITTITEDIIPGVQDFIAQVAPIVQAVMEWVTNNVALQDALIALGGVIAIIIATAIGPLIASVAPVVAAFLGLMAVAALLRTAWEDDWGGIQEKTAAVWAQVEPLLQQAQVWLSENIPVALEALRTFWVETAWPAIQSAVETVWPIIETIFTAMVDFIQNVTIPMYQYLFKQWTEVWWPGIMANLTYAWSVIQPILAALVSFVLDTVIPAVLNLYTQWTTVWWPTIQTVLENAWTVISGIFTEVGRWINDNIVPWVEFLADKWTEGVGILQTKLEEAWAVIEPVWLSLQEWLGTKIPEALNTMQPVFESVMAGISTAVGPVKTLWDEFVQAVSGFWDWISSHTFSFSIHLPDLPDWAVPGSPLPIHTAWKNFAQDISHMTIAPKFDMDAMLPVASLVQDAGRGDTISYDSQTTVYTNQDPMRVLRASRHLDKLGALAG